ncbi:MAG TPA: TetR/AcrR family transcriptional regulator [Rhizomicrobium sp.]|jgi:AcrR family transcriptional regulator|nr:TetR/AcrR family transcriptional regulator [Rhizomicrobium sp.]
MPRELTASEIEDFRDKLCDAALQIFAEKGVEGLTLREVAARLGVSPMTPYRYFKDKEDILAAIRTRAFNDFAQALENAVKRGKDAVAKSEAAGKAYETFAFTHPEAYRVMFDVAQEDDCEDDPALARAIERASATMSAHVKELVKEGAFDGDPELIGYVFWAAIHGLVTLKLSGKFTRRYSFNKVRRETFRALMQGFLKQQQLQ